MRPILFFFLLALLLPEVHGQTAMEFVPVTPCRVVDTRGLNGPFGGPALAGNTQRDFSLPQNSACNIPSNAAAYSLNVTVVPLTGSLNYLTIWPTHLTQPVVSTMNSYDGRVKANAAIVPAGSGNASVSVYVTDTTHVILDINGYFIPSTSSALAFYPLTPCRLADTRNGQPLQAGVPQDFAIANLCGIPSSAQAFSLNLTALPYNGQPLAYLTVWPKGESQPGTSTLNAPTGTVTANAAIVQSGAGGEISAYAYNETNLIIDVNGYFAPPGGRGQLALYSLSPCRVLDTRPSPFQGEYTVRVVTSPCSVPSGAGAYVVNATEVPQGALGYLTLWPDGETQPVVSTLNAYDGAVTSNMAIVPTRNGSIDAYNSDTGNLIIDIFSYLAPPLSNSALNGNYAFTMTGFKNDNGIYKPYVMAGALVTDGLGDVTGGYLDLNDGSGEQINGSTHRVIPQTITAAGSSYNLSSSGAGTMTLATNITTYHFSISIASATACVANPTLSTCGRMIESDASMPGSGVLKAQESQEFGLNFFPANLAMLYQGFDPSGKRYAGAGALGTNSQTLVDIDCGSSNGGNGWGLDGCPSDANYASHPGLFANPIKGTFSATIDPNLGRGDFVNLRFSGDPNGYCQGSLNSPACSYAYYIVNKQEMILISADPISKPANLTLWTLYRQQSNATGWNLNTLKGTDVVELYGVAPNGGTPLADISAGLFVGDGAGNATLNTDENKGGTLSQPQSPSGTYALDSADNGQKSGKFDLNNFTQFGTNGAALYMISPDQVSTGFGYIIGSDADVTAGILEQQSGSPFSSSSVAGGYGGGTNLPMVSGTTDSATFLYADGGGNITANQVTNGPGGPGTATLTLTYSVDSTGRAVVQNSGQPYGIIYVVSPTKFVLLPDNSTPALNVFTAGPND